MLDADISTRDALRLLTAPDNDPMRMGRRRFLQLVGMGVGAGALASTFEGFDDAWAGSPIGPTEGIVVLVGMFGGLDGLNTVVPYANGLYYDQHGSIAIPAQQVLKINSQVGLHPKLPYLKSLYDRGEVAVVQGVGYPNPDLSHFSSMATWMYGKADNGTPSTGWIGRWMDGLSTDSLLRAVTVGQGLPLHMIGAARRGIAVPQWGVGFGGETEQHDLWMYDGMRAMAAASAGRGAWHDVVAKTVKGVVDVGQEIAPVFARDLPAGDLEKKLTVAARLINANLGLRVVDLGYDGFDTHSGQPAALNELLADLDNGLRTFFTTLDDRFRSRVTIMTYSEFGRTSYSNDSAGTDHGTSNNHFVIGSGVKGGLYGQQASLAGLDRWDRMGFHVDFRSMYATVLDGWLGGGASTVLGANYSKLGLFRTGPGVGVVTGGVSGSVRGDLVALTPTRIYDSRKAPRLAPLGAGTTAEVKTTGIGGVPGLGTTAVVLNVSAVGGTGASSFTVWPTGGVKPDVANVSIQGTSVASASVTVKPGAHGYVNITNDQGVAHCVVEVVGYYRTSPAWRLQPQAARRILDTRSGVGGRRGALGAGGTYALPVRGVGGVPTAAQAVALQVTVVTPTATGALTVWPSGVPRPAPASMNFSAKSTTVSLVYAKIGADGKVGVYNSAGSSHVVVDVVGWFSTTARGRFTPLQPGRLLDTRPDTVDPLGPASATSIVVRGKGGVPSSGVSAVLLNVTAKAPTAATSFTVYPSGTSRPPVASLMARPGVDTSGAVLARLGADGKVVLFNAAGQTDVVVDVVGWFTS